MGQYNVSVTDIIDAPVEAVYAIISDYHDGHPSILPPQYFKEINVEQGGQGAGTVARVEMEVMGNRQTFRLAVTEPVPGRVLVEEDAAAGTSSRFTLEPLADGRTRVTITTEVRAAGGLRGLIERWISPSLLRRVYRDELHLLAEKTRRQGGQAGFG